MTDDGPLFPAGSVMMVVIVLLITTFVGFQVMTTITDEQLEQMEDEEISDTCMGVAGCGEQPMGLFAPLLITVVLAVIISFVVGIPAEPDGDDELQEVKRLYVEGDIHILELEDRLDDVMDDTDSGDDGGG